MCLALNACADKSKKNNAVFLAFFFVQCPPCATSPTTKEIEYNRERKGEKDKMERYATDSKSAQTALPKRERSFERSKKKAVR